MPRQAAAQAAIPTPAAKVDFETDVMPILRANCIECHGPDKQRAGMRIDRKSSVLKPFSRRVVPGSSENSFLYHRIMGQYGSQMPPDGALKPAQIAVIKNWIDQGAEWPDAFANEVDRPAPNAAAVAMVDSLRNDDLAAFMKSAGAQPSLLNQRGPEGSTPFMYAVIYANTATLEQLLKMGADPNRKNDQGATALMWAVRDLGKTRLLIEHGADVNAKSDDLRTPLMISARKPGNSLVVKLLLEHGANPNANAKPETESSALLEALTAGDAASTELLIEHGADAKATGETGLDMAITNNCAKCLDLIVPKITDKDVYTAALQDNAVYGDMRSTQILIDHGADVKAYDPLGRTALMYAVVSDMLPLDEVKLLIDRGSDVNARDKHADAGDEGVTVLDIAKRHGDTPIVRLLLASGAKPGGATPAVLTPRVKNDIRMAIQDGIPLLQHADVNFATNSGCISCHDNSLTAMTMGMLRKKGFAVDEKIDAEQVKVNAEGLAKLRDRMHQGMFVPVGDTFGDGVIAYMLLGLSAEGYKADINTDTAVMYIMSHQSPDGEWYAPTSDTRPPLCLDHIGATVQDMRALQLYAPKAGGAAYRQSIELAGNWLADAHSYSNDDRSWRVAGLTWSGNHPAALQKAIKELLATQKADGSWSDQPAMESTAYATGKSLVALHVGGLAVTDPAYKRGVRWLLDHQQQDGSWYVKTRALAFQPYFDAGFPGNHDQWISTAATNWAVQALTLALPETKNAVASRTAMQHREGGN